MVLARGWTSQFDWLSSTNLCPKVGGTSLQKKQQTPERVGVVLAPVVLARTIRRARVLTAGATGISLQEAVVEVLVAMAKALVMGDRARMGMMIGTGDQRVGLPLLCGTILTRQKTKRRKALTMMRGSLRRG